MGYLPIVKYLHEHGAEIEIENEFGSTCLTTGFEIKLRKRIFNNSNYTVYL